MIPKIRCIRAQMTVELSIVFPIVIVIAIITTNALSFFGYCADFDRLSRNAVRTYAASPEAGESTSDAESKIQAAIDSALNASNLHSSISVEKDWRGYEHFIMTLYYSPTLFGLGLKTEVFGVPMPQLTHRSQMTVDPYKPGMLF